MPKQSEKNIIRRKKSGFRELRKESVLINKIFKRTKILIHIVALILASIFTWLEFHDLQVTPMFTDKFSNVFLKITIALYYLSWVGGASKDLHNEEYALLAAPNKGRLAASSITLIIILGGLFAWLCVANTYKGFAAALSTFFAFNLGGWFYFRSFIKKSIEESKSGYENHGDSFGLFKMKTIENYLWGKWQVQRFIIGSILLLVVDIFSFSNISQIIGRELNFPSPQFLVVLSIFIYVSTIEIWMWNARMKREIIFEVIEILREERVQNN